MVDRKQVLEVLHYIKKVCEEQEPNCDDCMFCGSNGFCSIQDPPENWKLKDCEKEEKWTPFKD
jgi:hypothetical protein